MKMENKRNENIFWLILFTTLLFGLLLFNLRIDEGGDDSTYICRAIDVLANGSYPTFQGPLYPWFLSLFIAISGTNLIVLKLTSLVCVLTAQYVFWRVMKRRVNQQLVLTALALLSFNSLYLFFASQTYSESLYTLVQYLFMGAMLSVDCKEWNDCSWKERTKLLIPIAVLILSGFLIRTVGIFWLVAAVTYLIIEKKYHWAASLTVCTLSVLLLWVGVKELVIEAPKSSSQIEQLTLKHPYQPEQGKETVIGYLERFGGNSQKYLSKHILRIAGFKDVNNREVSTPITILLYLFFAIGTYRAYKNKNKTMLFIAVMTATMLGVTFFALQTLWDQYRLIIPYLLMIYIILLYGIYHLFSYLGKTIAKYGIITVVTLSALLSFVQTKEKIDLQQLRRNISGDMLYGYTPDWYNYLGMCKAAAEQLPVDSYIACRKPNMARIYGNGKKFYGIYNFNTEDPDELLGALKEKGVTHIILASLRRDPLRPGEGLINTIHRYMHFIVTKYPEAFTQVAVMGNEEVEPAYLFKINYEVMN
ncbi:MAG: glycosyltransferase family 39 protein [Marinilabiliaceae bacterium]|nr:glycosyltransferase family 39 protein [Marinilabiliaceae bacterium]